MKRFSASFVALSLVLGIVSFASAAFVSDFLGPQDLSQTWRLLQRQITAYISFDQAGLVGEMSLSPRVIVSGTSFVVVMPDGTQRYIQTSATP